MAGGFEVVVEWYERIIGGSYSRRTCALHPNENMRSTDTTTHICTKATVFLLLTHRDRRKQGGKWVEQNLSATVVADLINPSSYSSSTQSPPYHSYVTLRISLVYC